jgi:hypothetical protein
MFGTVGFGYGSLRSTATTTTYKLSTLATTDKGDRPACEGLLASSKDPKRAHGPLHADEFDRRPLFRELLIRISGNCFESAPGKFWAEQLLATVDRASAEAAEAFAVRGYGAGSAGPPGRHRRRMGSAEPVCIAASVIWTRSLPASPFVLRGARNSNRFAPIWSAEIAPPRD